MDFNSSDVIVTPKILNHGSYYVCYEAQYCGKQFMAKKEHLKNNISKKLLKREWKFLACLDHPYIVKRFAILDSLKSPVLLIERMWMSFTEYLTDKRLYHDKIRILRDTACGLQYIHDKGIIHCDLTADSILLTKNITAKLANFGRATFSQENVKYLPESLDHLPHEVFKPYSKTNCSTKVDVFSFGCVIIHAFTQEYPTPDIHDKYVETFEVGKYKKHSEVDRRSVCLKKFKNSCKDVQLYDMALKCLLDNPDSRPTVATLCLVLEKQLAKYTPISFKFGKSPIVLGLAM